ncbi:hypothetical protein CNMCM7691_006585 [Aspergillus felis]|uniref:Cytochrome P450 n=1 Tax=Aspergillus felis TaxID=1287682 RepID=A0A8H6QL58_9EURO|nr:hypothetical protein CNMCM7691_006585 [Aspergillus felis]
MNRAHCSPEPKEEQSTVIADLFKAESVKQISKEDIWAEGVMLSVVAMCATLFYLSRNAHAYTILANEIRGTYDNADAIRMGPRLRSCRYLRACIDEAPRMSPPVGGVLLREVGSVDGNVLHEGCIVSPGIYSIHHNPDYFPRPHEYKPERWLPGSELNSKNEREASRAAFIPFSTGPRACVGVSLFYWEISVTLARLMFWFDFKAAEGPDGELGAGSAFSGFGRTDPNEFQLQQEMKQLPKLLS